MKTGTCLLVLVACLLPEDPGAALMELDRAFYRETTERGLDGWLAWFAPDGVVLSAQGELVSGREDMRAYYAAMGFPPAGFRWEPERGEVAASGELGYTVGAWELVPPGATSGQEGLPGGRYLSVWKRQPDGSLRVLADSGGKVDFRTRLEGAQGPPREWTSTSERLEVASSGDLAYALGTWSARTDGSEHTGKFLTVWKRAEGQPWKVAAEIGFAH